MASWLRVDPPALCATAATESEVVDFLSGFIAAQPMTCAAEGLATLASGTACRLVGSVLDDVVHALAYELSAHSQRLLAAADHYRRADEDLSRRLRANVPGR